MSKIFRKNAYFINLFFIVIFLLFYNEIFFHDSFSPMQRLISGICCIMEVCSTELNYIIQFFFYLTLFFRSDQNNFYHQASGDAFSEQNFLVRLYQFSSFFLYVNSFSFLYFSSFSLWTPSLQQILIFCN